MNCQSFTGVPGGDLAKVQRAVCMIARVINGKLGLMLSKPASVHWYVDEGVEESELSEGCEEVGAETAGVEDVEVEEYWNTKQSSARPHAAATSPFPWLSAGEKHTYIKKEKNILHFYNFIYIYCIQ